MVLTSSFPFGEGESFLIDELDFLSRTLETLVVAPVHPRGDRRTDWLPQDNVEVHCRRLGQAARSSIVSGHLRRLVKQGRQSGLLKGKDAARNLGAVVSAANMVERLTSLDIEHLHSHWLSAPASAAMSLSMYMDVPWSSSAHRWDIYHGDHLQEKAQSAAFVRAISLRGAERLRAIGFPRVERVPLGIESPPVTRNTPQRSTVLCPANLIPLKGQRTLIRAARILADQGVAMELSFAGSGPELEGLRHLARSEGLVDVTFLGNVPRQEILSGYATAAWRAVVLPSLELGEGEHEGVPISLVEAMRYGVPVVSTETGSIPELLGRCDYNAMVPAGDATALATALVPLLKDDDHWRFAQSQVIGASSPWDVSRTAPGLLGLMRTSAGLGPR